MRFSQQEVLREGLCRTWRSCTVAQRGADKACFLRGIGVFTWSRRKPTYGFAVRGTCHKSNSLRIVAHYLYLRSCLQLLPAPLVWVQFWRF